MQSNIAFPASASQQLSCRVQDIWSHFLSPEKKKLQLLPLTLVWSRGYKYSDGLQASSALPTVTYSLELRSRFYTAKHLEKVKKQPHFVNHEN